MKNIKNQVILITGSTDGLGKGTATALASMGATILLHGRDKAKLEITSKEIKKASRNDRIKTYLGDYSSLAEVRRLAAEIQETNDNLDVLINNVGIGTGSPKTIYQRELSKDGFELRFSVNYLAHFLLTNLLVPSLRQSAPSRIVNIASVGQDTIDFSNVMLDKGYNGTLAYRQSKTAIIMFTFDLAERLKKDNITVNCLHPATYMNTKMVREDIGKGIQSIQNGVNAVIYLATSSELNGVTGKYFDQKQESRAIQQAYDLSSRKELRLLSENLTRVKLAS
jgi:NAD(P)-dependent dehydrogenase (short-subunit alcohol dehydrogenase family)